MKKFILVDTPYLFHRSYLTKCKLTSSTGLDSTMVYLFFNTLNKLRREHPNYEFIFAYESYGSISWRRQLYPRYKPRKSLDTDYIRQLHDIKNILYNEKIKAYFSVSNEADDTIASLLNSENEYLIYTVDKDIFQLVDDSRNIKILYSTGDVYNEQKTLNKFGVKPKQIPIYLALAGDAADNIPGIPGIGPKKAIKIINKDSNITLTSEQQSKVALYTKLTTLNHNAKLIEYKPYKVNSTASIIEKYEIKKLDLTFKLKSEFIGKWGTLDKWL